MTWTRLSDDYPDDCWRLTDAACRLHTDGLVWSNRKLLDLRIPKDDLPRVSKRAEAVPELLDAGFWTDDGDCYVIRHHGLYQRTREQVIARQETSKRNGSRGGRPAGPGRERTHLETQSLTQSESQRQTKWVSETSAETHLLTQNETRDETQGDGTGRDWKSAPIGAGTSGPSCRECQRRAGFNSGPCPAHRQAAS